VLDSASEAGPKTQMVRTVPVSAEIALWFGNVEALLIQQVHYWCSVSGKEREGHRWMYNTHQELATQVGSSERTVRRATKKLEGFGVLCSNTFNRAKYDNTKWYRVDYSVLEKTLNNLSASNGSICAYQVVHSGRVVGAILAEP
jgi:hypothetical protein